MKDVFKVQVPLVTNHKPLALVYNKDRSIQSQIPIDKTIKKLMGNDLKLFFHGTYDDKTEELTLGKRAPWQEW